MLRKLGVATAFVIGAALGLYAMLLLLMELWGHYLGVLHSWI